MDKTSSFAEREVVAVFDSGKELERAVESLSAAGLDRGQISVLGTDQAMAATLGDRSARITKFAKAVRLQRKTFVLRAVAREGNVVLIASLSFVGAVGTASAVLASGAALVLAAVSALILGALGATLGVILGNRFGERRADTMNRQLKDGSLFVWVHVPDEASEAKALRILSPLSKSAVYINDIIHRRYANINGPLIAD